MALKSVFRYLRTPTFPERKGRSDKGCGSVSPYKKYLLEQWNSGCHDTKKLYREIQVLGYEGSYCKASFGRKDSPRKCRTLARYTSRQRAAQGFKPKQKPTQNLPKVFEPKKSFLTVSRAVWLVLQKPSQQREGEKQALFLLKQQHPHLQTAIELTEKFAALVRGQQPEQLDEWIHNAQQSQIKAVVGFATKLRDDLEAVRNGVALWVSNNKVEGQVNRLKVLKRQMYGRASHELLKKRFLCPV